MSLKAKIEAIIYAAEEPVTLQQLSALLAEEAQAELAGAVQLELAAIAMAASAEQTASGEGSALNPAAAGDQPGEHSIVVGDAQAGAGESIDAAAHAALPDTSEAAAKKAAREQDRRLREVLRKQVDSLIADYATGERGMEIREVAGGYRMGTKPEYHDAVRSFVKRLKPAMKLSLQALESLAVVAYKQPVTAPEISEIRGVDSSGVLGSLISRKLITTAGRKQVIGRPILYKTTKEFLLRFGLKDLAELPSIEEFEKMAGELAEQDGLPLTDDSLNDPATQAMHSATPALDEFIEDGAAEISLPRVEDAIAREPDAVEPAGE